MVEAQTIKKKTPNSKKGIKAVAKKPFKRLLSASKDKILDKLLDQFKDQLSGAIKDEIKKIIQQCAEFVDVLNTVSVSKDTIIKIVNDFVEIGANIEDFINAVKDIIENLTDLTSLDALTSAIKAVVEMQQLKDFVENITKPFKEINCEDKEENLSSDSIVDEMSQALTDFITNLIVAFIKETILENNKKNKPQENDENEKKKPKKKAKKDGVKKNKNKALLEDKTEEKTPKPKNGIKSAIKKPFKRLLSASKEKIIDKLLDQFRDQLSSVIKIGIVEIIQQCGELVDILNTVSVSKDTIKTIVKNFVEIGANIEDFIAGIKDIIADLTDLTSIDVLISAMKAIVKMQQLKDFVENITNPFKKISSDCEDKEEKLSSGSIVEELSQALANFITNLIIDFIKETIMEKNEKTKSEGEDDKSEKKEPKVEVEKTEKDETKKNKAKASSEVSTEDKTPKSKKGIKSTKNPFKKLLSASKEKIIDKLLDQFKDQLSSVIKIGIVEIIQQCGELVDILNTVSVSKDTIKKIVKNFVEIGANIEDFIFGIKDIIADLTDLTSIDVLISAMKAIVKMQQLKDFVENITNPFKEISSDCEDKKEKLSSSSIVDELSQALADFITNLIIDFIKETIIEKNEKKKSEEEDDKSEKKKPKVEVEKAEKDETKKNKAKASSEVSTEDKTPKSKNGMKSTKNPFKRLLSASKEKIIDKLLDQFRDQLSSAIKSGIEEIIQQCGELVEILNTVSVSKNTIMQIVKNFVEIGANIEDFIAAIKDIIAGLTDLTSIDALKSAMEAIVKMQQLKDFVENITKPFKEISSDCKDKNEKLSSDSIIDEISQALADFITDLIIDFIKETIIEHGENMKSEDKSGKNGKKAKKKNGFKTSSEEEIIEKCTDDKIVKNGKKKVKTHETKFSSKTSHWMC